jgi:hypothetical protein
VTGIREHTAEIGGRWWRLDRPEVIERVVEFLTAP